MVAPLDKPGREIASSTTANFVDSRPPNELCDGCSVVEKLQADSRVEIVLTASESPELLPAIYAGANSPIINHPPNGDINAFRCVPRGGFLRAKLPRARGAFKRSPGGRNTGGLRLARRLMRGWDRSSLLTGDACKFIETGAIDPDSPSIRLIGMPKLDCLVDGSLKRDEILASLGIDPSAKTVLYAPTWSAYSSLSSMGEELVRRLGAAGYTVIVKLHDRSRQGDQYHSGGVAWGDRLLPLLKETEGARHRQQFIDITCCCRCSNHRPPRQ